MLASFFIAHTRLGVIWITSVVCRQLSQHKTYTRALYIHYRVIILKLERFGFWSVLFSDVSNADNWVSHLKPNRKPHSIVKSLCWEVEVGEEKTGLTGSCSLSVKISLQHDIHICADRTYHCKISWYCLAEYRSASALSSQLHYFILSQNDLKGCNLDSDLVNIWYKQWCRLQIVGFCIAINYSFRTNNK